MNETSDILWSLGCAEHFQSTPLSQHLDADLVIVGGGYTGLSAALEAAKRGARVVLVEAHQVGFGGSGRNAGLVEPGLWVSPDQIDAALGPTIGHHLTSVLASAPDRVFGLIDTYAIQCDPVRAGSLLCAHSKVGLSELQRRHAQLVARGAPVKLLGPEETARRTGAHGLHGALFDPRAGTLQPMAFARGLARAASAAGARIYEDTPALSLGWEDDAWEIATPHGYVRAGALLLATNAYPYQMSWVHPFKTIPVGYFQAATTPLGAAQRTAILPGNEGCWDTAKVQSSWRLDQAGRLIIGGMGRLDHLAGAVHRDWALRKIRKMFPELGDVTLQHFWQGRIALSNDNVPKIWRLGPNAYGCFGFSGRGIAAGTVFGQRLAVCLLDKAEDVLPIVPVNENAVRRPHMKGALLEAKATLAHFVKDRL